MLQNRLRFQAFGV